MGTIHRFVWQTPAVAIGATTHLFLLAVALPTCGQATTATKDPPAVSVEFPSELVHWSPLPGNPVFTAEGTGHWDVRIRERGWILRDGDIYQLWFTGYDGTRGGKKLLGYATSRDGLHWARWPKNPVYRDHWVEDVTVIRRGDTFYMFAEGPNDNHAEMLTSKNGTDWKWEGELDVRLADGLRHAEKPCGTPTIWVENDVWYLFYERNDKGVWLARSKEPLSRVWKNVRDEPVLSPGPAEYDKDMIAVNQVIKYRDSYFAFYHGSGTAMPRTWNTNIARSTDLLHWKKYSKNPIVSDNKSSGMVLPIRGGFRLYTMHDRVDVFESRPHTQ